jgi:ABC-type nitrate/sulfonate/bicarbonate transport system permease component
VRKRDVLFAAAALVALWQAAAAVIQLPIVPTPLVVAQVFVRELGRGLLEHFLASLWRVVASMILAVLLAAPAGLAIGQSKRLSRIFSPIIYLLYPIPKVVLAPILLLLLGVGDLAKIALIFLILFFQIVVLVRDQAASLPPQLLHSLRSLSR